MKTDLIYCKTFDVYFNIIKDELKNDMNEQEILSMESCFKQDYYLEIEKFVKEGGKISAEVYENLDGLKQYHFNKHYNYRNDKIENLALRLTFKKQNLKT